MSRLTGLLTYGLCLFRLPIACCRQWSKKKSLTDYSGGSVPEFHRFPFAHVGVVG